MDQRQKKILDQLWEEPSEEVLHVQELEDELNVLEQQVFEIARQLPDAQRTIIEGFLYSTAELELYTVVQAYKKGKELGIEIGKHQNMPLY